MFSNIYTVNDTEWSYLCWSAVKRLLTHWCTIFTGLIALPVTDWRSSYYITDIMMYERGVGGLTVTAVPVPRWNTVSHYFEQWPRTRHSSQPSVARSVDEHTLHNHAIHPVLRC